LRLISYYIAITLVTASCAANKSNLVPYVCEDDLQELYSQQTPAKDITIKGRVRIEVPEYRIRGACSIDFDPAGRLVIDFHHSSLFGAHSESATLHVTASDLIIYDNERGRYSPTDSSLALLRESLGLDLMPDDIIYALLFDSPACSEIEGIRFEGSEASWELEGIWRGRPVTMKGDRERGVSRFRLCSDDGTICYTIRYYYSDKQPYPERITVNRDHGSERLSLEVTDIILRGETSATGSEGRAKGAASRELLRFEGVSL
jgi:hypothetical protein